jgi:UPF0176 protein
VEDLAIKEPPISDLSRRFQLAAFYKFVALEELDALREQLLAVAKAGAVQGTILLAAEGLNGTVCGPEEGITRLLAQLRSDRRFADLEAKLSWAPRQSFYRLKVRLKNEIVTMGCPRVKPTEQVGTYVAPQEWDALINDPTTLVVDTRNDYEVAVGTFAGAIDPQISHFRQFPAWVEEQLRPLVAAKKPQRLALFCTGGIRCEKATAYLLQQGFEGVNHLQGGILKYLEQVPETQSSWNGECFVFDQRVAVNHQLEPGDHSLCHACGLPLAPQDRQLASYVEGVSCVHCLGRFSDADRRRFADRQRQMRLAAARGEQHLGTPTASGPPPLAN